ncbi:MAG TPA: glucodextranase DOMON-like domain-containing protein [Micromonosporaceae bacterium]|nr:glucodextranase DOMON-like domain-containing protein [Micromonosporaceae bacterium]
MQPRHPGRSRVRSAATVGVLVLAVITVAAPARADSTAPGSPGAPSHFDLARKDCVGTARNTTSKVWFTIAGGVLSDVYEPTVDNTDVKSLEYIVTDGTTFTDLQSRDTTYRVATDPTGMSCTVTATSASHGYTLTTTYITDPGSDSVLIHTSLSGKTKNLRVYAYLDAHVNGNGGGGSDNGGADFGTVDPSGAGVVFDTHTTSQATNRDYAVPTFMALSSPQLRSATVGFAGTGSDGLVQLDTSHSLSATYTDAPGGHIVLTEQLDSGTTFDLALGFGRTQAAAVATARGKRVFATSLAHYLAGWTGYDAHLTHPKSKVPGLSPAKALAAYYLSANVLKASEDKTYPGAVVASLASPWGQAVAAGTLPGGLPVYFGSYREVFARDLYEAFTGFLADGDRATAQDATRFLFERQQLPTGEIPRNSLLNGKIAPDTGGDQLDETSYPILMAYLSGLGPDTALWTDHVKPAADFVVAHGPTFGVERWEEQSGYSPSTIAAEIAGLTAAAAIATMHGDTADARVYQAVADDFQRNVKAQTVTSTGPYSTQPYFIRLSKTGDPNASIFYGLGNGITPDVDQRAVVDGGFQELVRLGELSPTDPAYLNSLHVLDNQISVHTATGTGYYRYGTSAASGSADGYGDCFQPSHSTCAVNGQPWPTTGTGTGHLWPVLSGERAESDIATGDPAAAGAFLSFMNASASGEGLVPEQVWEGPALAASPFGSDPTTASIGFRNGHPAGSAAPLSWAQAQELRLIVNLGQGRLVDQPTITTSRYVAHPAPANVPVTITAPAPGSTAGGSTTPVTGTTAPGATVTVSAVDTDLAGTSATVSTTADGSGAFTATAPVGFGTNVLTVTATTGTGTGVARTSVVGDLVGGVTVLDTADPAGDDNGPGTYAYPTSSAFSAGSFDITRFQVLTKDGVVYLRTTVAALTPTFGNTIGAQMLDVYVHTADNQPTSTAAAFPQRNYTVTAADAWSERLEVQGFAAPVWVDAAGAGKGSVTAVVSSTVTDTITIALPEAQFGTPGSGWAFTVVLTGQDGFSPDQARGFAPTPQDFLFGVCASGNPSPICGVDPSTVPKAMDVITPTGVDQDTELDPLTGPVVIAGAPVP